MKSKYITLKNKKLFPIGIGTWGIGGLAERDPNNNDEKQMAALTHMLKHGINYLDVCYWNAEGKAAELLSKAIIESKSTRRELFLVNSLYHHRYTNLDKMKREFYTVLELFNTNYIDSLLLLASSFTKFGASNVLKFYECFLSKGLTKYISVSNADHKLLRILKKEFGDKVFAHGVHLNFEIRANQDKEILTFAQQNDILNVIYQPLRRNRTADRNWPLLTKLSKKYGKTQNQIIMNWLVSLGYLPITKSETIAHIDEHLGALEFEMDPTDLLRISNFRPPGFTMPKVDWDNSGQGTRIDQMSNIFDEEYDRQQTEEDCDNG